MNKKLSSFPLLLPTLSMISGILLCQILDSRIIIAAMLIISIVFYFIHKRYISILFCAAGFGSLCFNIYTLSQYQIPLNTPINIIANIIETKETTSGQSVTVDIINYRFNNKAYNIEKTPVKVQLNIPSLNPHLSIGYKIKAPLTIERPENIKYLPDQFTYAESLRNKGIEYTAFLLPDSISSLSPSGDLPMRLLRLRDDFSNFILKTKLNPDTKSFLNTLITGDTGKLSPDVRDAFADSGLAHILALSGLHVAILSLFIFYLLYPLRITPLSNFTPIATIIILWFYALFTGMSPSVTRAVIMATIFLIAFMLQKSHNPVNSLCFAAVIILTFNPVAIYELSFQLSFLAVIGILVFYKKINRINPKRKVIYYIVGVFAISLSAMSFAGIVSAYYFHSFPIFFILSNALVSPIIPVFLFLGFIYLVIFSLHLPSGSIGNILDLLYKFIDGVTTFFTLSIESNIRNIYIEIPVLIVLIMFIASIAYLLYFKRTFSFVACGITFLSLVIILCTSEDIEAEGIYIVPYSSRTDIIYSSGKQLYVITTSPQSEHSKVKDDILISFKDYINRRGIQEISIGSDKQNNELISYQSSIFNLPKGKIAICSSDSQYESFTDSLRFDYLIICRGFKGDVKDLVDKCNIDTLILSADLHPKRLSRYLQNCKELQQPVISLRDNKTPSFNKFL